MIPLRNVLARLQQLEDAGGIVLAKEIAKNRKRNGVPGGAAGIVVGGILFIPCVGGI